jgi:hypothetical protein
MLNLNLNTLSSKLTEQQRGAFTGLVSASFVLYGGGGAGSPASKGGGGGASMVVSSSFHVVPNVTYTVMVGAGGSGSVAYPVLNGEDSFLYGFNQLASIPLSAKAGGGGAANGQTGGPSGDGYVYLRPGVSSSYSGYPGAPAELSAAAGGGGGGSAANGLISGDGGSGALVASSSLQTFGYYSSSYVTSYIQTPLQISYALGAAGGGAGGGNPGGGGFFGGGAGNAPGFERLGFGPGAGGQGTPLTGGSSGNGGDGRCFLIYCGVPKMDVTNATTTYDAVHNRTIHLFNKGTGSFYFDFEKYGAIEGCQ